MNIKQEIISYISSKETSGAVLITGKWGSGKTYYLKQIATEINNNINYYMVFVSLFGVESPEMLDSKVKQAVFLSGINKLSEKNQRKLSSVKNGISSLFSHLEDYISLAKSANTMLSFNLLDFISVEKEVPCICKNDESKMNIVKKELILVFDDLERCKMDTVSLLGVINEYSEDRKIKTIIIANEEKIEDDSGKYTLFKEKVIQRTLKYIPNYSFIITEIVKDYDEMREGYQDFLLDNIKTIITVFSESGYDNLRSLKSVIIDFERIYDALIRIGVSSVDIQDLLYKFCAVMFENKSGHYIKDDKLNLYMAYDGNRDITSENNGEMIKQNKIEDKYKENTFYSIPFAIKKWIVDGEWSEQELIDEINRKNDVINYTPAERFLNSYFWDLDQEIINIGLPAALNDAYNGNLASDQLLTLLKYIHSLKQYGVDIPCSIDYTKINNGLDVRISRIKEQQIEEPQRHTFVEGSQIDAEAFVINQRIENLDKKIMGIKNYNILMDFFEGNDIQSSVQIRNKVVDIFDKKMKDCFYTSFIRSGNYRKREMASVLLSTDFYSEYYCDYGDIQITFDNLNELLRDLQERIDEEGDCMSRAILNQFITLLKNTIIEKTPSNE